MTRAERPPGERRRRAEPGAYSAGAPCLGAFLFLLLSASLQASEMHVEPRTVRVNDLVTITLLLEGDFAAVDSVDIPLQNLSVVGEPSVSSEFAWMNGRVSRRKTFRYRVRPLAVGSAMVGPLVLTAEGRREMLAPVPVDVVKDRASASNDARVVLEELLATGREPLFVIAEVDRRSARVGEPVVVTWVLYNAAQVHEWRIVAVPDLTDFWAEELRRPEAIEQVYVGEHTMQRLPIRRVALFPLRSGRLRIDGVTIDAAVMRSRRRGPLSMYEGDLVESTFTAAPVEIDVHPLPPGPAVDAVGSLALECTTPMQRAGGPVTFAAVLRGSGNLRAAKAPRFDGTVAGQWRVDGGELTLPREVGSVEMSRRWEFQLFPASSGVFEVPPMTLTVFDTVAGARREIRCAGRVLQADVTPLRPDGEGAAAGPSAAAKPVPWRPVALVVLIAVTAAAGARAAWRHLALRREARAIVSGATPEAIRERVDARLRDPAALLAEASDRGDAYRALRSLLEAMARDRDIAEGAERELERRVREVLRA